MTGGGADGWMGSLLSSMKGPGNGDGGGRTIKEGACSRGWRDVRQKPIEASGLEGRG